MTEATQGVASQQQSTPLTLSQPASGTATAGVATAEPSPTAAVAAQAAPVAGATQGGGAAATPEASGGTASTDTAAMAMVLPGVDVLVLQRKGALGGRRIGLVTNATGRSRTGQSTIDVLFAQSSWKLVALFSPEHGIRGDAAAGEGVDSSVDATTGLPLYSLYGDTVRPTDAMLRGLDTLVYDIQDVGARPYTYTSTLLELMKSGAAHGIPVVVLDRPDPIGGDQVEGNVLDPRYTSFVGAAAIAMRYGLTIGELGQFFNGELGVGADLNVVPMQGWRRSMWFDQTGLEWINPSPNLRSLTAATVYPGTVLFEGTNLSEGRGTDTPFEWIGAPWIDGSAWASRLNEMGPPGVRFEAADATPDTSKFVGQRCHGVRVSVLERGQVRPMELGLTMLAAARALAPDRVQITARTFDGLAGTDRVRRALEAGRPVGEIVSAWQADLERFKARRAAYLLYS